jgi:predicted RNA binding protein YcfA (HicA-like mRNA interferase family)
MKLPRNLNGLELAEHFVRNWDYQRIHQTGSHIILETASPAHQRISIPAHRPLRTGTLAKILQLVASHKPESKIEILKGL